MVKKVDKTKYSVGLCKCPKCGGVFTKTVISETDWRYANKKNLKSELCSKCKMKNIKEGIFQFASIMASVNSGGMKRDL